MSGDSLAAEDAMSMVINMTTPTFKFCSTSTAAQICHTEVEERKKINEAFTCVTTMYSCKQEQDGGMSARAVVE